MSLARPRHAALASLVLLCPLSFAQDKPEKAKPEEMQSIFEQWEGKNAKDWSQYHADTSGASVSAFSLLGVSADSVANVQNVRDLTVAMKGFGSNSTGYGISVTPARTSITPMELSAYASSAFDRILGAVTLGYARGTATIGGAEYGRHALSIETNYFFDADDDPVLRIATAYKHCPPLVAAKPVPAKPSTPPDPLPATPKPGAVVPATAPEEHAKAVKARAKGCREAALKEMRWNRSQVSVAAATGWIRPEAGTQKQSSLGKAYSLGLTYGFDHSKALEKSAAAFLTLRRTVNEPVLDTLALPAVEHRSSSLAVLRIAGGSKTFRGMAEISNADSRRVTETQRAFKQAVGADYRIADGTWLNFRLGKQRTFDGSRNEVTSMISVSYSPGPKLE